MAEVPLLEVSSIETCYGLSQVLFGMSLVIEPGEMVTLMGRNGMGKTTTVRSIMGLTPATVGRSASTAGESAGRLPSGWLSWHRPGAGGRFQPDRAGNLVATANRRATRGRATRSACVFAERLASMANQSGGEQQMLAIGRR
jgi:branched-chain amino acid transport system ATP-binding protein